MGRNFLPGCLIKNSEMKLKEGNFRIDVRKTSVTARHFKLCNSLLKEKLETPVFRTFKVTEQLCSGNYNTGNKQAMWAERCYA